MSSLTAIETAFGQRIAMPEILPIVWPNRAVSPEKPYIAVQHVPTTRSAPAISGTGAIVARGYFVATVIAETNTFATEASGKADEIAARFPMGLRLTVDGRVMQIVQPAQFLAALRDGADWRQPVRIEYQVTDY